PPRSRRRRCRAGGASGTARSRSRSMADVDHLYAPPLEEFPRARDAAAKEIRKAGDRETAAIVAKLPKPNPAAWTANQVAREQAELIQHILAARAGRARAYRGEARARVEDARRAGGARLGRRRPRPARRDRRRTPRRRRG